MASEESGAIQWRAGVDLTTEYLMTFWAEPCYDAWEEYRSQLHTATLAAIYGGLRAIEPYIEHREIANTTLEIRRVIMDECVVDGRFVKHIGNPVVDASLLWVSTPFSVVAAQHPVYVRTVEEIERTLLHDGGVKRYAADTFYGGGGWIILTAWLGWHKARVGQMDEAREHLAWIEWHRDESGALPEQIVASTSNRRFFEFWSSRWGPSASPLLWSHAMNLVLLAEAANYDE